jgi:hypothetical protein
MRLGHRRKQDQRPHQTGKQHGQRQMFACKLDIGSEFRRLH